MSTSIESTSATKLVHSDPEIMGGTPVFCGTRLPIDILFQYLVAGDSIDAFLDDFETAERDQVIAVLELCKKMLIEHAYSS